MMDRRTENAKTLASLLGINTEEAAQLLQAAVLISFDGSDRGAAEIARHLTTLLTRTVSEVLLNDLTRSPAGEIAIGAVRPFLPGAVRVSVSQDLIQIGTNVPPGAICPEIPSIALLVAACYASGMALKATLGPQLAVSGPSPNDGLTIPVDAILGPDPAWLPRECELTDTYLAGAGAIGNGFLYALALLRVSGSLVVVDPDVVSDGNLNRCVWFTDEDKTHRKADALCEAAASSFPGLRLIPEAMTIQQLGKRQSQSNWLKRLIVGVDSRRARRRLQTEIPGEVFDASTTDVTECVLHHHRQPTDDACLACIYHETRDELSFEHHIAESLGVGPNDVEEHYVSEDAARRIHKKYPHIPVSRLVGEAYDSLFKALCSERKLLTAENKQVLAPFAFVSVLAGTYLAIELCRRLVLGPAAHTFNYWRFSPWAAPVEALKQVRPPNEACEFCSQPILLRTARHLWEIR